MRKKVMIAAMLNLLWTAVVWGMCWKAFLVSTSNRDTFPEAVKRAERANDSKRVHFLNSDYAMFLQQHSLYYLGAIAGCGLVYASTGIFLLQSVRGTSNAPRGVSA